MMNLSKVCFELTDLKLFHFPLISGDLFGEIYTLTTSLLQILKILGLYCNISHWRKGTSGLVNLGNLQWTLLVRKCLGGADWRTFHTLPDPD